MGLLATLKGACLMVTRFFYFGTKWPEIQYLDGVIAEFFEVFELVDFFNNFVFAVGWYTDERGDFVGRKKNDGVEVNHDEFNVFPGKLLGLGVSGGIFDAIGGDFEVAMNSLGGEFFDAVGDVIGQTKDADGKN